ncbi:MAG: hypothetical protein IKR11_12590 [Solobacterium sp.]|nr:hypothetical protein [Solobacterium sp.]
MKHDQFAYMKNKKGSIIRLNTQYITGYGFSEEEDRTVVCILGERCAVYFPGDQTHEIATAFNSIGVREGD